MYETEFQQMTKKEQEESIRYREIIDNLFLYLSFPIDWKLIFTDRWVINYNCFAIIINKQLLSQQNEFYFSVEGYGDIDFFLYNLINLFFKKLLYKNSILISICTNNINAATCLLYNKAVIEGYTKKSQKIKKEYFAKEFHMNDKRIKTLCKKLNICYDNQLLEDLDVNYDSGDIKPEFKKRVLSTDWKVFLFSLLPDKNLPDFPIKYNYDRRITGRLGVYNHSIGHEEKCDMILYLFPHDNDWEKFVNTVIHEFCHHLEACGVFSHYERENQNTHTPLFYAAIDILQNKSVLLGINLSNEIRDIEALEEKCSTKVLIILCKELGVDYHEIKEMKTYKPDD